MFGIGKIRELEDSNLAKDREIAKLESELSVLRIRLGEIEQYANTTPADCVRGEWCRACEFSKVVRMSTYYSNDVVYVCGKGESCKNFVQKERDY